MGVINKFIEQYNKEVDYYEKAAQICAHRCENEIERSGIRAIVSYRAKRADRLKDKLIKRNNKKDYECIEDVYKDIVDLAGVRIAIYFPGEIEIVDKFIRNNFELVKVKHFPQDNNNNTSQKSNYKKIFSGYHATHYRVKLKREKCSREQLKYCQANIEIQVASVLMHAWAEVEHDLVYKPLSGDLSRDEYEILDEINGLVLSGEVALRRLQKAVKERVRSQNKPFSNHYEVAAFLSDRICAKYDKDTDDLVMGRADMLFKFLKYAKLDKPQQLNKYIMCTEISFEDDDIVDQIINTILDEDIILYSYYLKAKNEINGKNPYRTIDKNDEEIKASMLQEFTDKWLSYQNVIKSYLQKYHSVDISEDNVIRLENIKTIVEDKEILKKVNIIQETRNEIVHSKKEPEPEKFKEILNAVESITEKLYNEFSSEEKEEIDKLNKDAI